MRENIVDLLDSIGILTSSFQSSEDVLVEFSRTEEAQLCVLANFPVPGLNELKLSRELHALDCNVPVILLAGYRYDATDIQTE